MGIIHHQRRPTRQLAPPAPRPAVALSPAARVRLLEIELDAARRDRDQALARRCNEQRHEDRFAAATADCQAAAANVERVRYELMRACTDWRRTEA